MAYCLSSKRLKRLSQVGLRNSIFNEPHWKWKFFCNNMFYKSCKDLPLRFKREFCYWLPKNEHLRLVDDYLRTIST